MYPKDEALFCFKISLAEEIVVTELKNDLRCIFFGHSKSLQSCPTLCDPMDCSPSGSSIHGILQARILGWVAISFSRGFSPPRDQTHVS